MLAGWFIRILLVGVSGRDAYGDVGATQGCCICWCHVCLVRKAIMRISLSWVDSEVKLSIDLLVHPETKTPEVFTRLPTVRGVPEV